MSDWECSCAHLTAFCKTLFFYGVSEAFLSLCFALLVSVFFFPLAFFAHMWFRSVCFVFFHDCMNSTQGVRSFQFSFGLLSYAVQNQIWFLLMWRLHKQTEFIWFVSHWSCSHNYYIIIHLLSAVVDKGKYGGSQQWQLKKGGCKFKWYTVWEDASNSSCFFGIYLSNYILASCLSPLSLCASVWGVCVTRNMQGVCNWLYAVWFDFLTFNFFSRQEIR